MVSRKRTRAVAEETPLAEAPQQQNGLLHEIRNMWEFANLMQYIYTFGKLSKISEDIEIDDLETECLKPGPSEVLLDIALSLLKFVTSNRGLTAENFEQYARKQYYAKAPDRNPFGDDEQAIKFNDLDVFKKIRVLQQFSAWSLWNPDKIRDRMTEKETEQVQWRIEELGYDRDDRLYYVLDDNRLYRRTDPPIPDDTPAKPAKPKANSKKGRALARAAAKKRKRADPDGEDEDGQNDRENENSAGYDFSQGFKWECLAVSLAEYQAFLDSLKKTKDPNEKILRDRLLGDVVPIIEQVEEAQQKKLHRREKELVVLQKLASAKRSSRLAGKHEKERLEREAVEEEHRQEAERIAERKKQEEQKKIEKERIYRLMTREQRLKDREEKRRKQEEELAAIAEQAQKAENGESRVSERNLKLEMAKREQDLAALQAEEDHWFFDCSGCGVHGVDLDDGSHSVACEDCNVWQHSKCLGIAQKEAEQDDFHFMCSDCKHRLEESNRPKIPPLKFRLPKATTPPSETHSVSGEKRKHEEQQGSPVKKAKTPPPTQLNIPPSMDGVGIPVAPHLMPGQLPPTIPTNGFGPVAYQTQPIANTTSPSKPPQAITQPEAVPGTIRSGLPPVNVSQQYPLGAAAGMNNASSPFSSQRPTSSNSRRGSLTSPIQNRPSMSPTQGNRDVGPLAGFPSSQATGSVPSTPFGAHPHNGLSSGSQHAAGPPLSQSPSASFSSTATPQATSSFSHTPTPNRYSPGIPMSGRSPTKFSPSRPPSFNEFGNSAILPPVQQLQPSPKLMGRSSPDAPIPPPVKNMTPEQEDRRRREEQLVAQQMFQLQQQAQQQQPQQISPQDIPPLASAQPQQQDRTS